MDQLIQSQIKVFYFGKFESAPFDKKELLQPLQKCQESQSNCDCETCAFSEQKQHKINLLNRCKGICFPMPVSFSQSHDFVQVDSGYDHTLLLTSKGEVITFGQGIQGQLGLKKRQFNTFTPQKVDIGTKIQRIKANAYDSAAFSHKRTYTWGANGGMKYKTPAFEPTQVDLNVYINKDQVFATNEELKFQKVDQILNLVSIDWGHHHMVFLDKKNRVFTMGNNLHGKTGQRNKEEVTELPTMIKSFCPDERLAEVICGPSHNLAVSHKSRVYSWGQGFQGKLGQGDLNHMAFPKQIVSDLLPHGKGCKNKILNAGCTQSTSIILQEKGSVIIWGKSELEKISYEEWISIPRQLEEKMQIIKITTGMEHFLMCDTLNQLWVTGDNTHGCLGTKDNKQRIKPTLVPFFDNKRIIDFSCGSQFSVVIAESYDLTPEQEKLYFGIEDMRANQLKNKLENLQFDAKDESIPINSTKKDIQSTRVPICYRGGTQSLKIPVSILNKVNNLLENRNNPIARRGSMADIVLPTINTRNAQIQKFGSQELLFDNSANTQPPTITTTLPDLKGERSFSPSPTYLQKSHNRLLSVSSSLKSSKMNPDVLNIIKQTKSRKLSALSHVSKDDTVNQKTIEHYFTTNSQMQKIIFEKGQKVERIQVKNQLQDYSHIERGPKIKIKRKQFKTDITKYQDLDLENIANGFNPYEQKMTREQIERYQIQQSPSLRSKPLDPEMMLPFQGRELVRKLDAKILKEKRKSNF